MKINKYLAFISCLLLWAFNTICASPLVTVGDYASVFFNGSSSLIWQSNIFYDDEIEEDDWMLTLSPGFEVNLGNGLSNFDVVAFTSYEIQRFADQSELNHEYLHANVIGSYKGARLNLNAAASFDEEQTTTGEQGTSGRSFIQIDRTRAHLRGEYIVSPKFSAESGVTYSEREFQDYNRLADVESVSVPVDIFYGLTPKVDMSLGYQYTTEEVGRTLVEGYNRKLHFFNVGFRGEILPKLNGFFKVGYRTVNPDGSGRSSDSTAGLDAEFTYFATPKLVSRLNLNHGFDVGSEGQSTESTSAKLNAEYTISTNYLANAFIDLSYRDFKDGNDGQDVIYKTGLSISYLLNEYWRFGTGYTYFQNDSNRQEQGFVNHIFNLSASLRY